MFKACCLIVAGLWAGSAFAQYSQADVEAGEDDRPRRGDTWIDGAAERPCERDVDLGRRQLRVETADDVAAGTIELVLGR